MKFICLIVACMFVTGTVLAQEISATADTTKGYDSLNMARVYVIRSTGHVASAVNLRILVDEKPYCKLRNNRHAQFYVQPGTHVFHATSWDKPKAREKYGLTIPVEAGKTYYLSMHIKPRFMEVEIFMEEITSNSAAPLLQKYKLDECD